MSLRLPLVAAAVLAVRVILAPAALTAQQDTSMMAHDSGMMAPDSGMMDQGAMSHDGTMGHDSTMGDKMDDKMTGGANMMFMGTEGAKAAGDYEVTGADGKQQLTLTDDFAVPQAPDLYLVLSNGPTVGKDAVWLGKLKQPASGETFNLPRGKDLSAFTTLVVWSKKEKKAVATAEWHAPTGAMEHM